MAALSSRACLQVVGLPMKILKLHGGNDLRFDLVASEGSGDRFRRRLARCRHFEDVADGLLLA